MQTLYLMRHGETFFNRRGVVQGWCDSPLTERGREQARRGRDWLEARGISFGAALSSSSERAFDTLEIATRGAVPYRLDRGLKEFHYGVLEGGSYEAILPGTYAAYGDFLLPFGGESEDAVAQRMYDALVGAMACGAKDVLAVSHGACSRAFAARVCREAGAAPAVSTDADGSRHGVDRVAKNGAIYVYDFADGSFSLRELFEPEDV